MGPLKANNLVLIKYDDHIVLGQVRALVVGAFRFFKDYDPENDDNVAYFLSVRDPVSFLVDIFEFRLSCFLFFHSFVL